MKKAPSPSARSPCSKSITDKRMRRICSFTDFYSVLLDFLRLSGAMILTDYLLLESIQHRIGANKIRVRFTTEFFSNTDLSDSTDTYWGQDTVNRYFTLPHGSGDWGTIPGFAEKHLGIWSGFWEKTYKSRTSLTYLWEPTPIHFN